MTFALGLKARGVTFHLRGNRLHFPTRAYKQLTQADHDFIRQHRAELKDIVRRGLPHVVPEPQAEEPTPVMWTYDYRHRITDADVLQAFNGKKPVGMTNRQAYEHTREWLEQEASKRRMQERHGAMLRYYSPDYRGEE